MAVDHDSSLFIVPVRKVQGYEMHRDELGAGYNALRGLRRRAGINNPQLPSLGLQLLGQFASADLFHIEHDRRSSRHPGIAQSADKKHCIF